MRALTRGWQGQRSGSLAGSDTVKRDKATVRYRLGLGEASEWVERLGVREASERVVMFGVREASEGSGSEIGFGV